MGGTENLALTAVLHFSILLSEKCAEFTGSGSNRLIFLHLNFAQKKLCVTLCITLCHSVVKSIFSADLTHTKNQNRGTQ